MKTALRVLVTGIFALLPVILIYLLIGQLFDMMMALTTPIVDLLPGGAFDLDPRAAAAVVLLGLIVVIGLAALTRAGRRLGDWVEAAALGKLPLYGMFRGLASRFSGQEDLAHFRPALVETWPNMRTFAFVVEEHASGDYTIFLPIAPTPSVGYVSVIGREHVRVLDVPARQALTAVLSWGDGAAATLDAATNREAQ